MYEGDVRQFPKDGLPRSHLGITSFVDRRGGLTQVYWQEGATACVLVSDIPTKELVQLAFAKAKKVWGVLVSSGRANFSFDAGRRTERPP